uniref:DNA-binding protein n=1 Tax=Enterococcus hulanensis TaxID=2559929 RepID=UPI0036F37E7F
MNTFTVFLGQYETKILNLKKLPMVLTNSDLKREFQISDSTLNRLIKMADFPDCWYGIRGHYSRDQVVDWFKINDYDNFKEKMRLLRSI